MSRRKGVSLFDEVLKPAIARDEILVEVKSTAVNHLDLVSHLEKGTNDPDPWCCRCCGRHTVQLASYAGATVIATASGDDEAYVKSIGASR